MQLVSGLEGINQAFKEHPGQQATNHRASSLRTCRFNYGLLDNTWMNANCLPKSFFYAGSQGYILIDQW